MKHHSRIATLALCLCGLVPAAPAIAQIVSPTIERHAVEFGYARRLRSVMSV